MTVRRFEVIAKLNGRGFVCACDGLETWPHGRLMPSGAVCEECGHLQFHLAGQWDGKQDLPRRTFYSRSFVLTQDEWERFCDVMGVQIAIPGDSCYHNHQIPVPHGDIQIDVARSNHGHHIAVKLSYIPPHQEE